MARPSVTIEAPKPRKILNLHIKILTPPTDSTVRQMLDAMKKVYDTAGITVQLVSTETLNVRQHDIGFLNDLDIGACSMGAISEEQTALSNFRNNARAGDIVVYFCRTLSDAFTGCASFPANKPMAAIAASAPLYTLAHEVGHVLGLHHTRAQRGNRLMTGSGTITLTSNPPSVLVKSEIKKMRKSIFVK